MNMTKEEIKTLNQAKEHLRFHLQLTAYLLESNSILPRELREQLDPNSATLVLSKISRLLADGTELT